MKLQRHSAALGGGTRQVAIRPPCVRGRWSLIAPLLGMALVIGACGESDDGASVREIAGSDDTAGSESASASGSGSGSASGVASSGEAAPVDGDESADGGYDYATNVSAHRLVVADLCDIGDLLDDGDFDAVGTIYLDGVNSVNADGSIRSIGGFAADPDAEHGLADYYATPTPLDDFVTAALDGTGLFEAASDGARAQGVEKGMRNQAMVAWMDHELAAAEAKAEAGDFDPESGAVHNWDEAWAFYHGSQPECAPWATANSRAANFGTVGDDGTTALANEAILAAMIEGRDALVDGDESAATAAAAEIRRNLAIIYSQATVRYATLVPGDVAAEDLDGAEAHRAEGLAFWRVMEATLAGAGADADAVNQVLALDGELGATGGADEVRAALQPAWDTLGISDADIGELQE